MNKLVLAIPILIAILLTLIYLNNPQILDKPQSSSQNLLETVTENVAPSPTPAVNLQTPSQSKVLDNGGYHIFQTFNNCGPASLSIALSYFGINISQKKLGDDLRPYQIPGGDNDDKSVTLEELAEKSKEYDLIPYHRPMGNLDLVKLFITYDIPIIARTWTKPNEDIGHYRVVKGFDGDAIIQDDSLQGKNLRYSEKDFNVIWKKFNFEYLVLVPKEKQEIAESILKEDLDPKVAWQKAARLAQGELEKHPDDVTARFNLSVAYANIGDFQKSVEEFEKVENKLSFRILWYQIEPIEAYFELGNYGRVLQITDKILNNHNRAFSELYILRAKVYKAQGKDELVEPELEKARLYNKNLNIPSI